MNLYLLYVYLLLYPQNCTHFHFIRLYGNKINNHKSKKKKTIACSYDGQIRKISIKSGVLQRNYLYIHQDEKKNIVLRRFVKGFYAICLYIIYSYRDYYNIMYKTDRPSLYNKYPWGSVSEVQAFTPPISLLPSRYNYHFDLSQSINKMMYRIKNICYL